MMRITYYHGGFGGDITDNVFDGIKFIFDNDRPCVTFHSSGHGYVVPCEYVKKIEEVEY